MIVLRYIETIYPRSLFIDTPSYQSVMNTLDASIERFKQGLPAIERSTQLSSDSAHTLLLIHSLTHSATIQLHWPFTSRSTTSINRCLAAANTIVRVMQVLDVKRMEFINPILGVRVMCYCRNHRKSSLTRLATAIRF